MVPYAGPAGSTRMMRAPMSANNMAKRGSGPMPPSSTTVTPASGPVDAEGPGTNVTMPDRGVSHPGSRCGSVGEEQVDEPFDGRPRLVVGEARLLVGFDDHVLGARRRRRDHVDPDDR